MDEIHPVPTSAAATPSQVTSTDVFRAFAELSRMSQSPPPSTSARRRFDNCSRFYHPRALSRRAARLPHPPFRPYWMPYWVPERTRTKSESTDPSDIAALESISLVDETVSSAAAVVTSAMDCASSAAYEGAMDIGGLPMLFTKLKILKRSKSMEDVRPPTSTGVDGSQPSHEMEFVSSRIQKLKVQE